MFLGKLGNLGLDVCGLSEPGRSSQALCSGACNVEQVDAKYFVVAGKLQDVRLADTDEGAGCSCNITSGEMLVHSEDALWLQHFGSNHRFADGITVVIGKTSGDDAALSKKQQHVGRVAAVQHRLVFGHRHGGYVDLHRGLVQVVDAHSLEEGKF